MGLVRSLVGTAIKEAKRAATDAVARRSGTGRAEPMEGSSGVSTAVRAAWKTVGVEQARRWNVFALEIQGQWRDQEGLARGSAGGELFTGLWLAVGEMVTEAWQQAGRVLATAWSRALGPRGWEDAEAVLDAALADAWSGFQPIWGDSRPRLEEILERMTAEPGVPELQQRVAAVFASAEQRLAAAWQDAREPFKRAVRQALEPSAASAAAGLEAAWRTLEGPLEQTWRQVIRDLEAVLR